jgi:hypothetical protein
LHDAGTSQFKVQRGMAKPIGAAKLGQMQEMTAKRRLTLPLNTKFSAELRKGLAQARPQSAATEPSE